ncbi:MAG: hypothetical protein WC829_02835 [Hyphomicrobium sp.]|jgi:hypothetical protein
MKKTAFVAIAILALCLPACKLTGHVHWPSPPPGPVVPAPAPQPPDNGAPPPPPVDGNPGTPPDAGSGTGADAIPMSEVVFYGDNAAAVPSFRPTATLRSVRIAGDTTGPCVVCWTWDDPRWPGYGPKNVMGNAWIMIYRDGKWRAGAWEMVRTDMVGANVCRTSEAKPGEYPLIQAHGPASEWTPRHGEEFGYMITTTTRGSLSPARERSNAVVGRWP